MKIMMREGGAQPAGIESGRKGDSGVLARSLSSPLDHSEQKRSVWSRILVGSRVSPKA